MKGTIMEQKKKRWIVLDEKGRFRKISINHTLGLEIGDQMEVEEAKLQMNWRGAMAIVTAMLVIFSGWLYQVPYGFMVVDINPSTELVYNRFQRVLRVNPLNEDAEGLVRIQLKHRSLEFAVEEVVAAAEEAGFLEKDGYVLLTNQEKKNRIDEEGFVEDLYQAMLDDGMDLTIAALEVTENEYHYAKGIGVSPGKEILREQIKFQKGEIKEAGGSVGALIREVNRVTKPTKDEKDSARLIMQEEKRTRNNEESNAGQDRGQSQKGKDKTPPGQAKKEENSVDVEPRSENEDQTNGKGSPGGNGSAGNAGSSQNDGNSENDGNSGDSGNNGGDGSSKGNN